MAREKSNVVSINQKKFPIVGVLIFGMIFLYIAINLYIYLTKDSLSIYVVQAEALNDYSSKQAIVLREERLVYAKESGFVNYYLNDSKRVAKGSKICSYTNDLDIYALFSDYQDYTKLNTNDLISVKNEIQSIRNSFDSSDYSRITAVKDSLGGMIRELIDENIFTNLPNIIKETGTDIKFESIYSDESGVVSFYSDAYTGIQLDNVNNEMFESNQESTIHSLRTSEKINSSDAICRLVTNENWQVLFPVSEEEFIEYQDKNNLSIYINKDQNILSSKPEFIKKNNKLYCLLSFDNYMIRYINDRFLDIEIRTTANKGLSIPKSSVVEKEFYLIPINYIYKDESDKNIIYKQVFDEKTGDASTSIEPISVVYFDDYYAYIDMNNISYGTRLLDDKNSNQYSISEIGKLSGVYQVNKGYSIFARIDKLYDNNEYVIISSDTPKGIRLFDHILLEGNKATESALIY